MTYRTGFGVPGYTGFIPMDENLPIPAKEAGSQREKLIIRSAEGVPGDGGTIKRGGSTFREDFSITPAQFAQGILPNPLWDIKGKRPIGDPPFVRRPPDDMQRQFIGASTFSDSYTRNLEPQRYPSDVTKTGQLRQPGTQEPTSSSPFYVTEYAQKAEEGNVHMATKKILPPGPTPKERANRAIQGVNLRIPELTTSYRQSFGKFGVDPYTKVPNDPSQTNFKASTAEHFQGTTKASYHPPGYAGFIPETGRNLKASQQGVCVDPREGTKHFEQQILFQYPHQVPGYGGYRPQTAINDVGPVRNEGMTTAGRSNISATSGFVPGDLGLSMATLAVTAPQRSVFGKSGSLQKTAFSHESMSGALSDNGRHDAEIYFQKTRPMEGRSVAIIKQGHWNQLV
uniref:Uncharacterized protein n=1 Tax=Haptolina ericina TaxID=156174 RepID=A0A7S3AVZ4_9EUKA